MSNYGTEGTDVKVSMLKTALADLPDDYEIYFVSNGVEEFRIDAAIELPDVKALYLGETDQGLADSIDELDTMDGMDWAQRQEWLAELDADEEEDDRAVASPHHVGEDLTAGAIEGSDLPLRDPEMCSALPRDRVNLHETSEYLEAM